MSKLLSGGVLCLIIATLSPSVCAKNQRAQTLQDLCDKIPDVSIPQSAPVVPPPSSSTDEQLAVMNSQLASLRTQLFNVSEQLEILESFICSSKEDLDAIRGDMDAETTKQAPKLPDK
jgi:hypothetical protein